MKLKIFIFVLIIPLLAACKPTPTAGPTNYPPPVSTATPYPAPTTGNAIGATPYPGSANLGGTPANPNGTSTGSPYPDPLQPIAGEENMTRGNVFIDESGIIPLESMPPQYELHLVGNLPTPCHKLRAKLSPPDAQNQIQVEVYSVVNPDEVCSQVLSPFDTNIHLGSYPTGKYTVLLNGEKVGEIDAP